MSKLSNLNISFTIDNVSLTLKELTNETLAGPIKNHSQEKGIFKLHYVPSGYGQLKLTNAMYSIIPGSLFLTGPGIEHAQTPIFFDPMKEYSASFYIPGQSHPNSEIISSIETHPLWFGQSVDPDSYLDVSSLFEEIFKEAEEKTFGWESMLSGKLSLLFVLLARHIGPADKETLAKIRSISSAPKDKTKDMLDDYFLHDYKTVSLEELAKLLNLGRRQSERIIYKHYGKSFQDKKTECKMDAAVTLLNDRSLSLKAIAFDLGYSSAEHFTYAFKKAKGVTPSEFRRHI